jgi:molecular chaperone DnaK
MEGSDASTQDIQTKMDELIQASQEMATRLYQQAAASQAGQGEAGDDSSAEDEDIVEAEIVDEDE